jgi:glutamate/aspartate transport system substrate-binding protein
MKKLNPIAALVLGAALIAGLTTSIAHAQANDTLAKVKASGVINMGVRDSSGALSYTLGDGKYAGFHVEVCQRIVAEVEKAAGRKLETKYVSVTSANRIPLTQNGTVDIECGSTTNNATRQKDVSFLNTTYLEEVRIAVKANSGITGIAQLNGKNVATTTGTTSVQHLRKHERATGVDFQEVFGKDHADFRIVGEVLSVEPIAIMIRKDDAAFKKLGNDVIAGMVKSGDMAKLYDKWFMQPIPPRNTRVGLPLSDGTKGAWAAANDNPMEAYAKK